MRLTPRVSPSPRNFLKPALVALAACAGLASLAVPAPVTAGDEKKVDFAKEIQPIFQESCIKCHRVDPDKPDKKPASGFRLDDKAAAFKGGENGKDIVAGNAKDSVLYKLLLGPVKIGDDDEIMAMPKAKKGEKFKAMAKDQVELIEKWIDQGAQWPE